MDDFTLLLCVPALPCAHLLGKSKARSAALFDYYYLFIILIFSACPNPPLLSCPAPPCPCLPLACSSPLLAPHIPRATHACKVENPPMSIVCGHGQKIWRWGQNKGVAQSICYLVPGAVKPKLFTWLKCWPKHSAWFTRNTAAGQGAHMFPRSRSVCVCVVSQTGVWIS